MHPIIVLTTVPDMETANRIADSLVSRQLVACVNIIPSIMSIYRWQDKLERSEELLLFMKTEQHLYEAMTTEIKALHPYEVPEIIAVDISDGNAEYLQWITQNVLKVVPSCD